MTLPLLIHSLLMKDPKGFCPSHPLESSNLTIFYLHKSLLLFLSFPFFAKSAYAQYVFVKLFLKFSLAFS